MSLTSFLAQANPPPPLPPDTGASPSTLAYVVMSSGTTGTPKGICCPHRGAVHSYHWRRCNDPLTPKVDVSGCNVFFVWECIRPLLAGGTTLVIPDHAVYDPKALTDILQKYRVSRMQFTPSLLAHIMASLPDEVLKEKLKNFKYVNLCGEVVTKTMVEKVRLDSSAPPATTITNPRMSPFPRSLRSSTGSSLPASSSIFTPSPSATTRLRLY